jgi:transposase
MTSIAAAGGTGQPGHVAGVDTHDDTHVAAVHDWLGRPLGDRQFPATGAGYRQLERWLRSWGPIRVVGIEGTSSYGAGLARHLSEAGLNLLEVTRPDRSARRAQGKSDPLDAHAAARAALTDVRVSQPKRTDGAVEAIRNLRVARRSAVEQRSQTQNRIRSLIATAPEQLRSQLRTLTPTTLIRSCTALRPDRTRIADPEQAVKTALRSLARRHQTFTTEIAELDEQLVPLVEQTAPALTALPGVGTDSAAQFLITAGQNPHRTHREAAFAMLCGAAPIPASSGKNHRFRLNRGGDRQANAALYRIVCNRLRYHAPTRAYAERRTALRCPPQINNRTAYPDDLQ